MRGGRRIRRRMLDGWLALAQLQLPGRVVSKSLMAHTHRTHAPSCNALSAILCAVQQGVGLAHRPSPVRRRTPAAVGAASASAASVYVDQSMKSAKGDNMLTSASCAPDNFWTLLGDLVGMGGWFLILLFVVPMLLGWILPGPLEKKKKK